MYVDLAAFLQFFILRRQYVYLSFQAQWLYDATHRRLDSETKRIVDVSTHDYGPFIAIIYCVLTAGFVDYYSLLIHRACLQKVLLNQCVGRMAVKSHVRLVGSIMLALELSCVLLHLYIFEIIE